MKITRHIDMVVNGRLSHSWYEGADGDHVPLPLDASAVPDAVVERVAMHIAAERNSVVVDDNLRAAWPKLDVRFRFEYEDMARAAIAALAQALGEP